MADHYDTALAEARESLARAQKQAAAGDWFAEHDVEAIRRAIADLEREAAVWRAKSPEEREAELRAREERWAAFDAAADAAGDPDDDEDEED